MVNPRVLETIAPFNALTRGAREALAARAVVRTFGSGQYLWRAGDEPRGLFVVLDGCVRVVLHAGRRLHVVHVERQGATLGEVPLFGGGGYPASAMAAEPTRCLVLDRSALRAVLAGHPDLAWELLGRLARRVRQMVERLASQRADPLRARLASYLLSRPVSETGTITLGGTQQALAEELGTVREVVVRQLRDLAAAGSIRRRSRGLYEILDAQALAMAARNRPARPQGRSTLDPGATPAMKIRPRRRP